MHSASPINSRGVNANTDLSHTTIENAPRRHAMVMKKIEGVVIRVSKQNTKKAK